MREKDVGKAVKARRKALDMTQTEASRRAKMQQGSWSAIETGQNDRLTLITLRRIAKALRCSVGDLVD